MMEGKNVQYYNLVLYLFSREFYHWSTACNFDLFSFIFPTYTKTDSIVQFLSYYLCTFYSTKLMDCDFNDWGTILV